MKSRTFQVFKDGKLIGEKTSATKNYTHAVIAFVLSGRNRGWRVLCFCSGLDRAARSPEARAAEKNGFEVEIAETKIMGSS